MKFALAAVLLCNVPLLAVAAPGSPNLVTNGGFEATPNGGGELGFNTNATGWTTDGYNFLFTPGSADSTGVTGSYGNLQLWGPNNGSPNGLPATSPAGGNYVAADGAFIVAPIQQTIDGLIAGNKYTVGFYWAGAQQYGFSGPTTEQWDVSLGNQTFDTAAVANANHGFTGWMYQTFTFTADSSSDVLSFLAVGTPDGEPPFSLLDGVTLNHVPEPTSLVALVAGLTLVGVVRRRRRRA